MKFAIMCNGIFYNINYYNNLVGKKHTSKNLSKVQEVCYKLQSQYSYSKFKVVKIKKHKELV